jgi:hypothetical protein
MSSRLSLLNNVFQPASPTPGVGIDLAAMGAIEEMAAELLASSTPAAKRRTQIWELHNSLHCSVIGTCLSTTELRQVLVRLKMERAETADDHDLHRLGVTLAGRPKGGAKALQKALDRRHRAHIARFAKAKTAETLTTLWQDALKASDIPGAYWAVLTHPATTDALITHAFGDVHMLSHLVGAANRADIRRLRALEAENAALSAKIERQQRQLRDGFTSRDATIRRLNQLIARGTDRHRTPSDADPGGEQVALHEVLADTGRRLAAETARRERLAQRLVTAQEALAESERQRKRAERECDELRREFASIETRLLLPCDESPSAPAHPDVSGYTVLYVGGRAHQVPRYRTVIERAGGNLLHHDAGVEHSAALLPGLLSRADIVVFPVDCVSHEAVATIKRSCQQLGKRYVPLRTASLASLVSTLGSLEIAAEPVM